MKILLITDIFPPQVGGPATFISRLAEKLSAEYGYRVTVVCTSEKPFDTSDIDRTYIVRRLYKRDSLRYKLNIRRLLVKEMLSHQCILVNGLEVLVYQIARTLHRPYILKVVGDSVWETARNMGRTKLDFDTFQSNNEEIRKFQDLVEKRNRSLFFARYVVTPSEYLNRVVGGWGVPRERIITIPNGSDLRRFAEFQARPRGVDPLQVLFVGRLTNWKGVETLLLSLKDIDNVQVTIIGDGPQFLPLFELSKQLNLSNRVDFLGRCSQAEVQQHMASAHALILTSLYEGLSHTILEAMALGLPCIVSNLGGNVELITSGKDGILIPAQNVQELVCAIKLLATNEEVRQSISKQARIRSLDFSIDSTVQHYTELLIRQTQEVTP